MDQCCLHLVKWSIFTVTSDHILAE